MKIIMLTSVGYLQNQLQRGCVLHVGGRSDGKHRHIDKVAATAWLKCGYAEKYEGQTLPDLKPKDLSVEELKGAYDRLKASVDGDLRNVINRAEQAEAARDDVKDRLVHAETRIAELDAEVAELTAPPETEGEEGNAPASETEGAATPAT